VEYANRLAVRRAGENNSPAGVFGVELCVCGFLIIAGGKSLVPAYALPVLFVADLFLAQFIESAAILIQFAREQADG